MARGFHTLTSWSVVSAIGWTATIVLTAWSHAANDPNLGRWAVIVATAASVLSIGAIVARARDDVCEAMSVQVRLSAAMRSYGGGAGLTRVK